MCEEASCSPAGAHSNIYKRHVDVAHVVFLSLFHLICLLMTNMMANWHLGCVVTRDFLLSPNFSENSSFHFKLAHLTMSLMSLAQNA